eukprot:SM000273S10246  [mRNA]  locus=s273:110634:118228:- [translate_table: standard]
MAAAAVESPCALRRSPRGKAPAAAVAAAAAAGGASFDVTVELEAAGEAGALEVTPDLHARRRKRRSSGRRVSFADVPQVRHFVKDDEYQTPPELAAALEVLPPPCSTGGEPAAAAAIRDTALEGAVPPSTDVSLADRGLRLPSPGHTVPLHLAVPAFCQELGILGRAQGGVTVRTGREAADGAAVGSARAAVTTPPLLSNDSSVEVNFYSPATFVSPLSSEDGLDGDKTGPIDMRQMLPLMEAAPHPGQAATEDDTTNMSSTSQQLGTITALVPNLRDLLMVDALGDATTTLVLPKLVAAAGLGAGGRKAEETPEDGLQAPATSSVRGEDKPSIDEDPAKLDPTKSDSTDVAAIDTPGGTGSDILEDKELRALPMAGANRRRAALAPLTESEAAARLEKLSPKVVRRTSLRGSRRGSLAGGASRPRFEDLVALDDQLRLPPVYPEAEAPVLLLKEAELWEHVAQETQAEVHDCPPVRVAVEQPSPHRCKDAPSIVQPNEEPVNGEHQVVASSARPLLPAFRSTLEHSSLSMRRRRPKDRLRDLRRSSTGLHRVQSMTLATLPAAPWTPVPVQGAQPVAPWGIIGRWAVSPGEALGQQAVGLDELAQSMPRAVLRSSAKRPRLTLEGRPTSLTCLHITVITFSFSPLLMQSLAAFCGIVDITILMLPAEHGSEIGAGLLAKLSTLQNSTITMAVPGLGKLLARDEEEGGEDLTKASPTNQEILHNVPVVLGKLAMGVAEFSLPQPTGSWESPKDFTRPIGDTPSVDCKVMLEYGSPGMHDAHTAHSSAGWRAWQNKDELPTTQVCGYSLPSPLRLPLSMKERNPMVPACRAAAPSDIRDTGHDSRCLQADLAGQLEARGDDPRGPQPVSLAQVTLSAFLVLSQYGGMSKKLRVVLAVEQVNLDGDLQADVSRPPLYPASAEEDCKRETPSGELAASLIASCLDAPEAEILGSKCAELQAMVLQKEVAVADLDRRVSEDNPPLFANFQEGDLTARRMVEEAGKASRLQWRRRCAQLGAEYEAQLHDALTATGNSLAQEAEAEMEERARLQALEEQFTIMQKNIAACSALHHRLTVEKRRQDELEAKLAASRERLHTLCQQIKEEQELLEGEDRRASKAEASLFEQQCRLSDTTSSLHEGGEDAARFTDLQRRANVISELQASLTAWGLQKAVCRARGQCEVELELCFRNYAMLRIGSSGAEIGDKVQAALTMDKAAIEEAFPHLGAGALFEALLDQWTQQATILCSEVPLLLQRLEGSICRVLDLLLEMRECRWAFPCLAFTKASQQKDEGAMVCLNFIELARDIKFNVFVHVDTNARLAATPCQIEIVHAGGDPGPALNEMQIAAAIKRVPEAEGNCMRLKPICEAVSSLLAY